MYMDACVCVSTGLKKWVEVGNSGVFRPEMLLPMGLPEDVSVIAWGLSLERSAVVCSQCTTPDPTAVQATSIDCLTPPSPHRPTMIKYGISNIRELVGHKVNLEMVYNNSICRL